MKTLVKSILVVILVIGGEKLFAQSGSLFIYTYNSPVSNTDNRNLSVLQGNDGLLYFANSKGVITYDGVQWNLIRTYDRPVSLAINPGEDDRVYVGNFKNFGYITSDAKGTKKYVLLSEANKDFGEISQIIIKNQKVFYFNRRVVFQYSIESKKIENVFFAQKDHPFDHIFLFKNTVYLNTQGKGLQIIEENKLKPVQNMDFWGEVSIKAVISYDDQRLLIGSSDNKFYLFDGQLAEEYQVESGKYIRESTLISGLDLNEKEFVLTTLSGGCLIIDKKSGITRQTINYQTGLSDDEVYAVGKDKHNGLWICNEYGVSRVDTGIPIYNYSDYPGLEGTLITALKLDTTLYAATSEGVFFLKKTVASDQVVKMVKEEKSEVKIIERNTLTTVQVNPNNTRNKKNNQINAAESDLSENEMSEKKKKRLEKREQRKLNRLKKKGEETEAEEEKPLKDKNKDTLVLKTAVKDTPVKTYTTAKTTTQVKLETYAFQSFPFLFNKVNGLNAKCKQLLPFQGKILVAASNGLYEIEKSNARQILGGSYIHFITQYKKDSSRFFIGTRDGLISILFQKGKWNYTNFLTSISQNIFSIAELNSTLWLGGENAVFRVVLDVEGNPLKFERFQLNENNKEQIIVRIIANQPVFFLSNGIYTFDEKTRKLLLDSKLMNLFNPRSEVYYNQQSYTWIKPEENNWINIQNISSIDSTQTAFLSLFDDIQDIYIDAASNIWVIGDQLYKIDANARLNYSKSFEVIVRDVKNKKGESLELDNIELNYRSGLKIDLSSGFFLRESNLSYRYKIEGLDNEWSAWEKNTSLNFPFLPSGQYKIHIESKNIFGQKSTVKIIQVNVNKPFWQTWYFYLLSTLVIGSMIYGIVFLRTKALKLANLRLEAKINEKTAEIASQKEQLQKAFEQISVKNLEIEVANKQLTEVNTSLEDKVYQRTEKLRNTLVKLLETNKELDTFIYRSSHDMKSPITRMLGLANLAKMDTEDEELKGHLTLIEYTAQNMITMLDKLNYIHSINQESIELKNFDVLKLIERIKTALISKSGANNLNILIKIESDTNIYSDETLIQIILENLLENAIVFRHSENGTIPIIKLIYQKTPTEVFFKVVDNGVGIKENHKNKIFDMFYRGSDKSKGNGLGLYLTKKAVDKMKGKIDFESEPDKMTVFQVMIPVSKPEPVSV